MCKLWHVPKLEEPCLLAGKSAHLCGPLKDAVHMQSTNQRGNITHTHDHREKNASPITTTKYTVRERRAAKWCKHRRVCKADNDKAIKCQGKVSSELLKCDEGKPPTPLKTWFTRRIDIELLLSSRMRGREKFVLLTESNRPEAETQTHTVAISPRLHDTRLAAWQPGSWQQEPASWQASSWSRQRPEW